MATESARQALGILRQGSHFEWYLIPFLALVLYVYANEIERRNWNVVFAGLALWGMDWFNEIWNGLVFHFTQYAPVWGAPGRTAFLILIGLNIEISFMFAIAGVVVAKTLPAAKGMTILGLPNRWVIAIAASVFCVVVEMLLNAAGALTWDYWWWNVRMPWLIVIFGYLTFFVVSFWVHDMPRVAQKAKTVAAIFAVDVVCLALFAGYLQWI
jgi:NADH:ubiquinone oxidoreductase subunit 6 (subunit J)